VLQGASGKTIKLTERSRESARDVKKTQAERKLDGDEKIKKVIKIIESSDLLDEELDETPAINASNKRKYRRVQAKSVLD